MVQMKHVKQIGLVIVLLLVGVQGYVLAGYWRDQRSLEVLLERIASPSLPPSAQARMISNYLEMKSSDTNRSYLLHPSLAFLSATPWQVAIGGGNCADRSRFLVVLLRMRGIRASKWALYSPQGKPVHAVVELQSEQGKMVIDPLFDLWFPRPGDGYYGIQDLKRDPELLRQRVHYLRTSGKEPIGWVILGYPLDEYVYDGARTINWDKSALMRLSYQTLHLVLGERTNQLERPFFVEQPALMIAIGIAGLEALLLLAWLMLRWRRGRQRRASTGQPCAAPSEPHSEAVVCLAAGDELSKAGVSRPNSK